MSPPLKRPLAKTKDPRATLIGDAACSAARVLASGQYGSYENIRADVMRSFAMAFARAYDMPGDRREPSLGRLWPHQLKAYNDIVDGVDCSVMDPEHYGHVHENLSGWSLADGNLVSSSERRNGGVHFTPRTLTEPIVQRTLEHLFRLVPPERTLELRVCDPSMGSGAFLVEVVRQLAARLVAAGVENDLTIAKRLVAIHCIYGVDVCRWAVASAKITLWFECRAHEMPTGWLDDNLKLGDALTGLLPDQFDSFHWVKGGRPTPEIRDVRILAADRAASLRTEKMSDLARTARVG